jgi:hypothetical protein
MRSGNGSWALALAVALLGPLLLPLAVYGLVATIWSTAARNYDPVANAAVMGVTSVEFALAGLLGIWRGRRRRLAGYLEYLLSVLPLESRGALVDLAYEEAKRAA